MAFLAVLTCPVSNGFRPSEGRNPQVFFIKNHLGGGEPVFRRLGSKFLSTTISKDLDEVLTWESRYLGHLRPIITMMIIIYTNIDAR